MMRKVFTALCLLLAAAGSARAAEHDGRWSVLVITEKGACDPGYRYEVSVGQGRVVYAGDAAVGMDGSITPNGSVKVSVGKQGKNAIGSGRHRHLAQRRLYRTLGSRTALVVHKLKG
jgi:hypothetical protein